MRRIVILGLAMVMAAATPALASGDDGPGARAGPHGDPVVFVETPGADPIGSPSGTGSVACYLYNVTDVYLGDNIVGLGTEQETNPEEGHGYLLACFTVPTGEILLVNIITYQPGV